MGNVVTCKLVQEGERIRIESISELDDEIYSFNPDKIASLIVIAQESLPVLHVESKQDLVDIAAFAREDIPLLVLVDKDFFESHFNVKVRDA